MRQTPGIAIAEVASSLRGRSTPGADVAMGASFDERLDMVIELVSEEPGIALENLVSNVHDFEVTLTRDEAKRLMRCAKAMSMPKSVTAEIMGLSHPHAPDLVSVLRRLALPSTPVAGAQILGVTLDLGSGLQPINGLRHLPEGGTTGWYLWAGETFPTDDNAFQPLHVEHLHQRCPQVLPYLVLPPGWRFLVAPGHEDVWFDDTLL